MKTKKEISAEIFVELVESIKKTYHLYIKFFLSLEGMPPTDQDDLAEEQMENLTLASMASQDITTSLMSSAALSTALIGLKKGKEIAKKINDRLNEGCPCKECEDSGTPISLKLKKELLTKDATTGKITESLKTLAAKTDKKLN